MPDPIETYLDEVMRTAALSRADTRRVRAELREHLHEMLADTGSLPSDPKEASTMLSDHFGDPQFLGKAISSSKGHLRTWLKKKARRAAIAAAVLCVLWFGLRATVAEACRVVGDSVSPDLPAGSECLVYKLASEFHPGDVIVYRPADHPTLRYIAIVKDATIPQGDLTVYRRNTAPYSIPRSSVIGRVFLNTR